MDARRGKTREAVFRKADSPVPKGDAVGMSFRIKATTARNLEKRRERRTGIVVTGRSYGTLVTTSEIEGH